MSTKDLGIYIRDSRKIPTFRDDEGFKNLLRIDDVSIAQQATRS